jgi:hypothetical protein
VPVITVSGDPTLTRAQTLLFGHNARARIELGALETALLHRYPAAFAAYGKACRRGRLKPGDTWTWREATTRLAFCVVRESSVGATRLRYVQAALHRLARDYRLEGITSLAIAPLGSRFEWPEMQTLIALAFRGAALPVIVYRDYRPGVAADEPL